MIYNSISQEDLQVVIEQLLTLPDKAYAVLDTETTLSENWAKEVLGISMYVPSLDLSVWIDELNDTNRNYLNSSLQHLTCIFHNAKFDMQMLKRWGIDVTNNAFEDTMLISYVHNEEPPHGLKELAVKYIDRSANDDQTIVKTLSKAYGWENLPTQIMGKYAIQDVQLTWKLFQYYQARPLDTTLKEVLQKDYRFMKVLLKIESEGIEIDAVEARLKSAECIKRLAAIQKELGFDPGKSSQLAERLYSDPPTGLGLKPIGYGAPSKSFPNGRPSMGVAELKEHHHPLVGLVLEYRRVQKAKSTWYDGWLEVMSKDQRIHPTFHQHTTVTSRLSCSNPNMQQIPRDSEENETKSSFPIKKLLRAASGRELWELDYSQVELRLASVYADEQGMQDVFRTGGDPHQYVGDTIGVSRFIGKTINFLVLYGGGAEKLRWVLKQNGSEFTSAQCESFLSNFHDAYPGFRQCIYTCMEAMVQKGYIQYWTGRRRHLESEHYKAFNSLIQGGAAEIMRESLIQLDDIISDERLKCTLKSQVHDSIWIEVDEGDLATVKTVQGIMEWPTEDFGLPFPVDIKRLA